MTTSSLTTDNTLFDFDAAERQALQQALEAHGYPFDPWTEQLYLSVNRILWRRFDLGTIGKDELLRERFAVFLPGHGRAG